MSTSLSPRSVLFVPASRPELFDKALASGADRIIIDLEDAVDESGKSSARLSIERWSESHPDARFLVRINAPSHPAFYEDLRLCRRVEGIERVMVPKCESADALRQAALAGKPLWALVETARGIAALDSLAAVEGLERLALGELDLATDLGLARGSQGARRVIGQLRVALLVASRANRCQPPMAAVSPAIDDLARLEAHAREAEEMGFAGMLCIHPRQLAVAERWFAPSEQRLAWARRVVERAARGEAVFELEGEMVDLPVIEAARRLLARA